VPVCTCNVRSLSSLSQLPAGDPRPLHGPNLFPTEEHAPGLRTAVLEYMREASRVSALLLCALAAAIGLSADHFAADFKDATTLFRIFHYPPHDARWGPTSMAVGEHSDYGYLTVLWQDESGGLQAKTNAGYSVVAGTPREERIGGGPAVRMADPRVPLPSHLNSQVPPRAPARQDESNDLCLYPMWQHVGRRTARR
jgi:hypothetical protein